MFKVNLLLVCTAEQNKSQIFPEKLAAHKSEKSWKHVLQICS